MREINSTVTNADLIAYADGQLPEDRLDTVKAFVRSNVEAARYVEALKRQNEALHAAFDPVLLEPVPQQLLEATRRRPVGRQLAAIAAAFVIGLIGGWQLRDVAVWQDGSSAAGLALSHRAALAHTIYVARDEPPLDLHSSEPAMVSEWLGREARITMSTPRLADLGYQLLGGRLMMGDAEPASLLVYVGPNGERLSLFIQNDLSEDIPSDISRKQGLGVVRWAHAGRGYSIAGQLANDDLDALASAVRLQMRIAMSDYDGSNITR
ncbi:MAG: anti-sigma factor [Pseudomonadota bacterium]